MRVLLVDHDSEGLEAVARAIRGVLELDCVTSKGDALLLLRQNTYDVLIACERCVDGSGLDLLARTTRTNSPLKRIFSAPLDRLQLLGPRLAPFKVQRTINYPIDLEELWLAIAQVTGTSDDTDGTIERVVLDERGIPSTGTMPRSPIPPRPPAPLREVAPTPTPPPAPAIAATMAGGARAATARIPQPVPEPPLRAPAPPRTTAPPPRTTSDTGRMRIPAPPPTTSDTGRMRAPLPPRTTADTGRMRAPAPPVQAIPPMSVPPPSPPPLRDLGWTPEVAPVEDDFAEIAAQARLGVQQKVVDEAARRKRTRLFAAGGIAVAVAASLVFLIEKFYDPEGRARERAIAQEVERMAEHQKFTDNLTRIEVDIESAIMKNDFDAARASLADLVAKSPEHPRRAFLQASIERAAELAKLEAQKSSLAQAERAASRREEPREERATPRPVERTPARPRDDERITRTASASSPPQRVYGAPIGEAPRATLPLDAPINAPPTTVMRPPDTSFPGRTVEASDGALRSGVFTPSGVASAPVQASTQAATPATNGTAGAAVVSPLPAAPAPAPAVPAAMDVVPAKLVKRVAPVAPANTPLKSRGQVVVQFEIGLNGRVSDIEILESDPRGVFDDAVRDAVRKWVYEPRKENGVAVISKGQARLVFEPSK